jgi:uncharacterized coiled-coil protein SlyX
MTFLDLFKDISIKEYKRAGIGAVMIIVAVWYLYSQNEKQAEEIKQHNNYLRIEQQELKQRITRLEDGLFACQNANVEVLRAQVDKSNNLIEKTDRHLDQIEILIKNK